MSRAGLALASVFVVLMGTFPAAANAAFAIGASARGGSGGHGHGGGGGGSSICDSSTSITNCGFDVSYPQCGASLPGPAAFAIVGVNGGLANDYNTCLSSELSWASGSTPGSTGQPPVSLYVNTADPGNMYNGKPIADWPQSGGNTAYGSCTTTTLRVRGHTYTVGENSAACAWQYGYNMAQGDASQVAGPATYTWWLDVETANSWQTDTTMNLADLEGMQAAFQGVGATTVGVYSTPAQWSSIMGTSLTSSSSLYGTPDWIPGATSYTGAQSNCGLPSFTGGPVTLTQWTGTFDSDYACP